MKNVIKLATRGSPLALRQAELTCDHLSKHFPDTSFEIVEIKTTGDKKLNWSLEREGGVGLFTKELEKALLAGEADIAIHSAKDLPSHESEGLRIAGYLPREEVNDVLVLREGCEEPVYIATSSPRRRMQAKKLFPCAVWSEIRGNVDTRLKKIASGQADATLLAAAGLKRLGIEEWPDVVFRTLNLEEMVPAGGQGAVALQVREGEEGLWSPLLDEATAFALNVERCFLRELGVGCHTAFGVHYVDGQLLIYYEETNSHHAFKFDVECEEKIEARVQEVIDELKEIGGQ